MLIELNIRKLVVRKNIKCFTIDFDDFGLESDNVDGWEHWMGFIIEENPSYTSKQSIIKDILNEEDSIITYIGFKDYKNCKEYLKKTDVTITIIERKGLPFFIKKYRKIKNTIYR